MLTLALGPSAAAAAGSDRDLGDAFMERGPIEGLDVGWLDERPPTEFALPPGGAPRPVADDG